MAAPEPQEIDIVIPNWNGREMLKTCLESIARQTSDSAGVTIVDNGSTDGSVEFVRSAYPAARVICFAENRGFSVAVNAGINNTKAPLIFLLNNDTELETHCIERLLDQSREQKSYDMFALKMLDFNDRDVIDGAGDGVLRGGVGYRLGTMERDGVSHQIRKEVFGACAGAVLYRRQMLDKIGLFDEDFFAYLEDVDLNMRAVRGGYRCCYLPDAIVYHVGSASSGSKINPFTVKLSTRNNVGVLIKNYSSATWLHFLPALLVYQFFWLLFVLKKRQFPSYLSGLAASIVLLPKMIRKGIEVRKSGVLSEPDFRKEMLRSEKEVIESIIARRRQHGKTSRALNLYLRIFC